MTRTQPEKTTFILALRRGSPVVVEQRGDDRTVHEFTLAPDCLRFYEAQIGHPVELGARWRFLNAGSVRWC